MGFVENLIFFVTVPKLWKLVHIWQSYHRLCNVLFFYGPQCIHGEVTGDERFNDTTRKPQCHSIKMYVFSTTKL